MMLFIGRYSFIFRPELGPKQQATAIYFGHMVIDNSEARSWADSTKHSVTFEAWVIWRHSPLIPASPGSVLRRTEVQTQNICSADLDIKVTPYIFFYFVAVSSVRLSTVLYLLCLPRVSRPPQCGRWRLIRALTSLAGLQWKSVPCAIGFLRRNLLPPKISVLKLGQHTTKNTHSRLLWMFLSLRLYTVGW